jgi:hypothetical protein
VFSALLLAEVNVFFVWKQVKLMPRREISEVILDLEC